MKKIMTYLFLVMMTVTGTLTTACSSSDDEPATPVQKANTLTVVAGMSDNITRALADAGTTLTATWAADDVVEVYEGSTHLGALRPQTTGSATTKLTGVLDPAPSASGVELTLKYKETNYSGQDGTLAKIGSTYNYCKATTIVTQSGNQYSGTPATFVSQQAIVKFTLKKKSDESVIKATTMNIKYGETALNMTLTPNDYGIYYIATPACDNKTFQVSVSDGTKSYIIEAPSTTFAAGSFYRRNVLFTYNEIKDFTGSTGYTIEEGYHYLCRGENLTGSQLILNVGSEATLDGLNIRSLDNDYGIQCDGNATINLKDGTTSTITGTAEEALIVKEGKLTITGTGTLTLIGHKTTGKTYTAVKGKVLIDGNEVDGDKADDTYDYTNLRLVVSDGGNKWVISKKPSAQ